MATVMKPDMKQKSQATRKRTLATRAGSTAAKSGASCPDPPGCLDPRLGLAGIGPARRLRPGAPWPAHADHDVVGALRGKGRDRTGGGKDSNIKRVRGK